ncbi:MAG: cupin domain-containing protein [Candidatus Diapherotrites archaeon]|jgi:mannose-6-phosphate isomerase-like protein (cupin superfamily)|nr:cupin domain-containing protein [Candidatus Diapherotrites archaeon]MBT4597055.1 cupin domain-containing protein [Candidatus Diapherotrites archaeon]
MKIIRKDDVTPIDSSCGALRELYSSGNIDISHNIVTKDAKKHLHKKMEEVYYITKGEGIVVIGEEEFEVREGDTIPIPKNTWHQLKLAKEPFELIVVIHPKFDASDEIFEGEK